MASNQEDIVQRMIDAGESEENIATVIKSFKSPTIPTDTAKPVIDTKIPTTDKLPNFSDRPVETPPPADNTNPSPEHGSFLSRAWHAISDPLTDAPSRFAKSVGDYIDQPSVDRSPLSAQLHGFVAGGLQGIGDLVSGATSPINLATMAATGGASAAESGGYEEIANALRLAGKATSAPVIAHGASETFSPDSTTGERAQGVVEMAGGGAGMMGSPTESTSMESNPIESAVPAITPSKVTSSGSQSLKPGTVVVIKADKATPIKVKQAKEAGFEFEGINDQGDFRFKKSDTASDTQQPILESEVGNNRPQSSALGPVIDAKKSSMLAEALNLPRALESSVDLSAPLRQGLGLIHKPAFWKALGPMMKSWGSEDAFQEIQKSIADRPLFKPRVGPNGTTLPSFAEDAGLKLTDLTDLSKREESIMSNWAEKVPGVRPSNRAYTAFLNKLRADTFESLIQDGKIFGADGETNLPLARGLADFVNTATGRGSLGKLENSAVALNSVFFSPRLIASRLKMLNPQYYIMAQPMVRKEALKSLMSIAGVGLTLGQLAKMSGLGTVESDSASADFGKIKVGNTRIDPFGGFQQYVVAAQRLMPELDKLGLDIGGRMKSTTTGKEYKLGTPGFGKSDRADVALRFARGKTNPALGFAWALMAGQKELSGQPMNFTSMNPMTNAISQRFIPMLLQDLYEIGTKEPQHLPAIIPDAFGMGVQQY